MSIATVYSRAQSGMDSPLVSVEVHLANGLPCFSIVGLPEAAVRESKDRVRAAIVNSNFEFPRRRITVNLAPADLPKEGGRFDLPIAIGILVASKQLDANTLDDYEFIGELSLSGEIRKSAAVLPAAYACCKNNAKLITAQENQNELQVIGLNEIYCSDHLLNVCSHLNGHKLLSRIPALTDDNRLQAANTLHEVYGQHQAKRALSIAAAGHHHVLMVGSPGSGKTMLASRMSQLLTPMTSQEALETCSIYSVANVNYDHPNLLSRPFRSPHHTVSAVGLAGGGSHPKPGEISLAHNGVLFLDEFTEFDRRSLEILREPLETGKITISRAARKLEFPANFQLIAAMNPCANGCDIDEFGQCGCSDEQLRRYRNKISAPLLDRIDLQINVPKLPRKELISPTAPGNDQTRWLKIQADINDAREIQMRRQHKTNAYLNVTELAEICYLSSDAKKIVNELFDHLKLSARSYHRILKVARTIADLAREELILKTHIAEAASYRQFDRLLSAK